MNKPDFYIDGKLADVNENVDFTRVYRGSDNLSENKNSYSLTIKFPFTYTNQKIFLRSNSLAYKSDFPYQEHTCIVKSNGVTLVDGKVILLATTDSFECSVVWDNVDVINELVTNETKLGILLKDFPLVNWDYNTTNLDPTYSTLKAQSYGYLRYEDQNHFGFIHYVNSFAHPLINFKYLLDEVAAALGITLNIPIAKADFLKKMIIRPNKETDMYLNNTFKCRAKFPRTSYINYFGALQLAYNVGEISSAYDGVNSYYFKTYTSISNGSDGLDDTISFPNDPPYGDFTDEIPQPYRIESFAKTTGNVATISNIGTVSGYPPLFRKYEALTGLWSTIHTYSGAATFTFDAEVGDIFYWYLRHDYNPLAIVPITLSHANFDFEIVSAVDDTLIEPNQAYFPSLYHIPTNIDLTVGEFISEALKLTGSELDFSVNDDIYYFIEKKKINLNSFDITKYVKKIVNIKYDKKYIYSKLAQSNYFKYLDILPVDADYTEVVSNPNLELEKVLLQSVFSTSEIEVSGAFSGYTKAIEHIFPESYISFSEQPLHLLWDDVANSKAVFTSDLEMSNIVALWWRDYLDDLLLLILSGSIRTVKLNAVISDVIFKQISMSSPVYIETYGKYYGIIEVEKNGNKATFFLLELF